MKKKIYEIQVKSEIQPPLDSNFNFVATHGQLTSNSRATANLKPFAEISTLSQSDSYPTLFAIPLWVRYLKKEVQGFLQTLENSQGLSSNHSIIPKTLADRLLSNLDQYFTWGENNVFRSDSLTMKALYLSCQISFLQPEDLQAIRTNLTPEFRSLKVTSFFEAFLMTPL